MGGQIWQTRNQEIPTSSKIRVIKKPKARQLALKVNTVKAKARTRE
jgi:hypothetical protein